MSVRSRDLELPSTLKQLVVASKVFVDLGDGMGPRLLSEIMSEADYEISAAAQMQAYVEQGRLK
ncbi:hypothetical protein ASG68_08385 [Rhizobium sp. Leaf453]|nr:hypothetical protein ASG68_08385 [Rhizobium sp. Leaf453]